MNPTVDTEAQAWNRFLLIGLVFLAFETVVLLILRELTSTPVFLAVAGAGGVAYLLLGVWAGTWLSGLFVPLPVFIAVAVGGTLAHGTNPSETPLYVSWTFFSLYFFTPAWLLGLLIAFLRRSYPSTTK
ncbi:MAG: hypothetical protein ACSLFD_07640 [Solirubrobacterales bacterium]